MDGNVLKNAFQPLLLFLSLSHFFLCLCLWPWLSLWLSLFPSLSGCMYLSLNMPLFRRYLTENYPDLNTDALLMNMHWTLPHSLSFLYLYLSGSVWLYVSLSQYVLFRRYLTENYPDLNTDAVSMKKALDSTSHSVLSLSLSLWFCLAVCIPLSICLVQEISN